MKTSGIEVLKLIGKDKTADQIIFWLHLKGILYDWLTDWQTTKIDYSPR